MARYADQVYCLNRRLLCSGAPDQVLTPETLGSLYGRAPAVYHHEHGQATKGLTP